MTDERNFDRIARAWLDLMPNEAPDRTIAAVLQAVETTPQVRSPLRWLTRRFPNMNRLLMPAAIAAAAVLAVGGGLYLTRSDGPSPGGPSPTPLPSASPSGASPSASSSTALTPAALRNPWLGEVVEAQGLPSGRDRSILQIGPSKLELDTDPFPSVSSDVASVDGGVLRLVARDSDGGCTTGDVGVYTYSLSPEGSLLQLSATEEDCAARRAGFEGEWQRSACRNTDNLCLGDLEAGTYKSQFIGPRLDEGEPWTANFGAISYTVPDGWSNTADFPDDYVLMRSADYAVTTDPKDGTKDLIEFVARPGIGLQNEQCEPLVKPDTGRSVDDLLAHVVGHPGLTLSPPEHLTIDGHAGRRIDVSIKPSWRTSCPDATDPILILFTETGRDMTGSGLEQPALWKTDKMRIVLLDLGDGDVLLVTITARDPTNFDALIDEAMPIVESLTFK
jgi:hypothetical protein